jgi:hypothetical protein
MLYPIELRVQLNSLGSFNQDPFEIFQTSPRIPWVYYPFAARFGTPNRRNPTDLNSIAGGEGAVQGRPANEKELPSAYDPREKAAQKPEHLACSVGRGMLDHVKQAFADKFPAVEDVAWKLKSDKNYEAEFGAEETATAVKSDPAGKWLETEPAIPVDQLPKAVQDAVAAQFKGYKVVETQPLVKANEQAAT